MSDDAELKSSYERWQRSAERYDRPHLRLRQVAAIIRELGGSSVLDIGCGRGHLSRLCRDVQYVGCDLVEPEANAPFRFARFDVNSEMYPSHFDQVATTEFDVIVCAGILEYVRHPRPFLEWLHASLGDGSHLITTYFNFHHVSRRMRRFAGARVPRHPDWANELSLILLHSKMRTAGLQVVRTVPMHHSVRSSPGVERTESLATCLPPWRPWSRWLAHQFIMVARRGAPRADLIDG